MYVSQNGAGNANGADVADAHPLAWLNNTANWGAGPNLVGPGTTVHLVGTFTSTMGVYGSGTPGNPITIYFEPNAMFSAPTLPANSIWMYMAGRSNLVIDGGVNGLIQLTDNGTVVANGGTCDYGNSVWAINANAINNVTIQNLTVSNMYNRQSISEPDSAAGDGCAIYWSGSGMTVSNCFLTGCENGISGVYGNPANSNLTVVGCTLSNYNHGIIVGSGGVVNPLFYNVTIIHNTLQGGDMFESPDGVELGFHRNPIFIFNESPDRSGCVSNILIAYNFIKHGFHPQSHAAGTGAMFFDFYNSQMANHVRVYNNISTLAPPLGWSGGGGFIGGGGTDVLVANNTAIAWQTNGVLGGTGQIGGGGANFYVYNNICVSGTGITLATYTSAGTSTANPQAVAACFGSLWSDYNLYNYQGPNSFYEIVFANGGAVLQSGLVDSLAQWTNMGCGAFCSHFDPHSVTAPVQLNANFVPLSCDTAAVGKGTNLTAWGITDDFAGNPRPATGNWTIGAYQATAGTTGNILCGVTAATIVASGSRPTAAGISAFVAGGGGNDITNGLLVQYKFDQASGTTAIDSSGNGYTGTLTGNAQWTNGLAGNEAVSFPSNNGVYASGDGVCSPAVDYSGDWTMTFWVCNSSFPGSANYAATIGSGTGVFVGPSSWGFYDGSTCLNSTSALGANAWYFIAVSKSSGTNYQLYLNGSANSARVLANVNISTLTIGNRGGAFLGMNGSVGDFRIFNRVLSSSEVSTLAANGPNNIASTILAPPTNLKVVGAVPGS